MNDHKQPQESNAEQSILASILLYQEDREKAFDLLTSEDFYSNANRIIFKKCKELQGNGGHIETADIYSALSEDEKKFVKAEFLGRLTGTVPVAVNIEDCIKRVKDAAQYRRTIELCNAIAKRAYKSDSEQIEKLTRQLILETKEPEAASPEQKDTYSSFPYQVMTGAAGYFANVYSQYLETPQSFLFIAYLTCLGSVLSKSLTAASELRPQPRLFTLILGQSADERKSTVLNKCIWHFKETLQQFPVCWGVGSAEGLQKILEKTDCGLLLCFDEFKQFVSKCRTQA
jgi:hypothetical protein